MQGQIPVRWAEKKKYKTYLGMWIVNRGLVERLAWRIELLRLQNVIRLVKNIELP